MKNRKKGFTLVECIVAIAVITVITVVAVSAFVSAQKSSDKEWDKFMSSLVADDSISAFQSAEGLAEFASCGPDNVQQLGSAVTASKIVEVNQPIPFKTIRAYEDGIIKVFNRALNVENDTYSDQIAEFNYGKNLTAYNNDVHTGVYSLDTCGIYAKAEPTKLPVMYVLSNPSAADPSRDLAITYTDTSMIINCNYSTWGLGWTGSEDKTFNGEFEYTPFEQYLWDNNLILAVPNNLDGKDMIYNAGYSTQNTGEMYFYLYKIKEDGTLEIDRNPSNSKQYHAICIKIKKSDLSGIGLQELSNKKVTITNVYEAYVTKEGYQNDIKSIQSITYKNEFKTKDGETFRNFQWAGLPLLAYFCGNEGGFRVSPHYDQIKMTKTGGSEGKNYIDYTLKDGAAVSALQIDYALYKNNETKFYADENDTLLFNYTGGDAKTLLEETFGLSQTGTDADNHAIYRRMTTITLKSETGYFYYLPKDASSGCFIEVTYSDMSSEDRKIRAWVLTEDEIKTLTKSHPEQVVELLPNTPDFSYRKG